MQHVGRCGGRMCNARNRSAHIQGHSSHPAEITEDRSPRQTMLQSIKYTRATIDGCYRRVIHRGLVKADHSGCAHENQDCNRRRQQLG
jgi:hypothetical protein